MQGIR